VTDGRVPDPDPRAQSGAYLTTAEGLRLPDTDRSLKAGARGSTLLEDFHLREKTTPTADIKLVVLLQEAFRHCKAVAAWGDGTAVLKAI
jgi:catalase